MSRHLAFLEGKPNEPLEMSEDEDDETGSEINVKVTSSQTKTPPNIVGKTIQFSTFPKDLLRAFWLCM